VNALLNRPLEGAWPYLWLDATYVKLREGGRIVSRAVIIAVAVNEDGKHEVLGVATGPSEAEAFWTEFLRSLADRGLETVQNFLPLRGNPLMMRRRPEHRQDLPDRLMEGRWPGRSVWQDGQGF
jgi:transposase-like protein